MPKPSTLQNFRLLPMRLVKRGLMGFLGVLGLLLVCTSGLALPPENKQPIRFVNKDSSQKPLKLDAVFERVQLLATGTVQEVQAALDELKRQGKDIRSLEKDEAYGSLTIAAYNGNLPVVDLLIKAGADVNHQAIDGSTALHEATFEDPAITRLLLEAGANVDAIDIADETPCAKAVRLQKVPIAALLLEAGANPRRTNSRGIPLLGVAIHSASPNLELIALLLEAGADPLYPEDDKSMPLLAAIRSGKVPIVRMLLETGVLTRLRPSAEAFFVREAIENGAPDLLELFLLYGFDARGQERPLVRDDGAIIQLLVSRKTQIALPKPQAPPADPADNSPMGLMLHDMETGLALFRAGEKAKAVQPLERALQQAQRLLGPDHAMTGEMQWLLANVLMDVGQSARAMRLLQTLMARLLPPAEQQPLPPLDEDTIRLLLKTLLSLAQLYGQQDRHPDAVALLRDNLHLFQPTREYGQALALMAVAASQSGDLGQANSLLDKAEQATSTLVPPASLEESRHLMQAQTFVRSQNGQTLDALDALDQLLGTLQEEGGMALAQQAASGPILDEAADAMYHAGKFETALRLYTRNADMLRTTQGESPALVLALEGIANCQEGMNRVDEARRTYMRAIQMASRLWDEGHSTTVGMYHALADLLLQQGDRAGYAATRRKAWQLALRNDNPWMLAATSLGLASMYASQDSMEQAILFGKRALHLVQDARTFDLASARTVDRAYVRRLRPFYRKVAHWLTLQGRLVEAQMALSMLRQQELHDYVVRSAPQSPQHLRLPFLPEEAEALRCVDELADWSRRTSNAYRPLWQRHLGTLSGTEPPFAKIEKRRLERLATQLDSADEALEACLKRSEALLAPLQPSQSPQEALAGPHLLAQSGQLSLLPHLAPWLPRLQKGEALLHAAVAESNVWFMLSVEGRQPPLVSLAKTSHAELATLVRDIRLKLADKSADPRPEALALYNLMLRPFEDALREAGIHTLLLSLDGPLRYLPFAALHDGSGWLVERYALSRIGGGQPASAMTASEHAAAAPVPSALRAFGTTKAHGTLPALPGVAREIRSLVRSETPQAPFEGQAFLDEAFTAEALKGRGAPLPALLHLATHFQFVPERVQDSFLLLGDGSRLTLAELQHPDFDWRGVEHVTFSACDTGMLDSRYGSGVEGLAALAEAKGVHSVLASLWPVRDDFTASFMFTLYTFMSRGMPRALALQATQKAAIEGTLLHGDQPAFILAEQVRNAVETLRRFVRPTESATQVDPALHGVRHPAFWAPFVLRVR